MDLCVYVIEWNYILVSTSFITEWIKIIIIGLQSIEYTCHKCVTPWVPCPCMPKIYVSSFTPLSRLNTIRVQLVFFYSISIVRLFLSFRFPFILRWVCVRSHTLYTMRMNDSCSNLKGKRNHHFTLFPQLIFRK